MATAIGIAPKRAKFDNPGTDKWLQQVGDRMKIYSGTANPTAAQVPLGQWIIYRNTTLNETRIWANWNGVIMSTAAFT